jgi:ribose 5-phosphate isomerase A
VTVEPRSERDAAKLAAGRAAVREYVRDGMKVGLGSGTTSHWFVRALGDAVAEGLDVVGAPTSRGTGALAEEVGVRLAPLDELAPLDITIDGADEIDPEGAMIKGGGACLLWEKIVANASRRMVAVVDAAKIVDPLGAFPLPIEVIPFGRETTRTSLRETLAGLGYADAALELRVAGGEPVVTDSGHHILDAHLGRITDKEALAAALNVIPGVVEHGLFIGVAEAMIVGHPDGSADVIPASPPPAARAR